MGVSDKACNTALFWVSSSSIMGWGYLIKHVTLTVPGLFIEINLFLSSDNHNSHKFVVRSWPITDVSQTVINIQVPPVMAWFLEYLPAFKLNILLKV